MTRLRGRAGVEQRKRRLQLYPLCSRCLELGRVTATEVIDHVKPLALGGTDTDDNCQGLCWRCHRAKTGEDFGHNLGVDADGWPIVQKPHTPKVEFSPELMWPSDLRPSALPLTIVCGPPAAGKSTYVQNNAKPGDTIIDLDAIISTFASPRTTDRALRLKGLERRNLMLRLLADEPADGRSAWFITAAADGGLRSKWARMLKPQGVLLIAPPIGLCLSRVEDDRHRRASRREQRGAIERWFKNYTPWAGDRVIDGSGICNHR